MNAFEALSGPLFTGVLEGEAYDNVNSVMDILALPKTKTALPAWRLAYLSGELVCKGEDYKEEDSITKTSSLLLGQEGVDEMMTVCGRELGAAFISLVDVLKKPVCSPGKEFSSCKVN